MQDVEQHFVSCKDDVYRLALSYTRSKQEAEDICQTVFLKFMEQKHITPGKEKAWLMQVTANLCRNLLKSSWWRKTAPLEDAPAEDIPRHNDLYQAVMGLVPKYRVVVYLYYYEEYSVREIGQLLHISQTAVTTRLARARQMLGEILKEDTL